MQLSTLYFYVFLIIIITFFFLSLTMMTDNKHDFVFSTHKNAAQ